MTRTLSRLFTLFVALVALLAGQQCHAHFPWLATDDQGRAIMFFGETPGDRTYHMPEAVAKAEVMVLGHEGVKPFELAAVEEDDLIGRRSADKLPDHSALATTFKYGIYHGTLLSYYAKFDPALDHHHPPKERPRLDVDLLRGDDGLQATVYWEGKPVKGATATLVDAKGESQEGETGDDGKVAFKTPADGLLGLVVGYVLEDATGKFNGEDYVSESHYATVAVQHGAAAAEKKEQPQLQSVLPPLPEGIASFGGAVCDGWLYVYSGHTGKEHDHSRENLSQHFRRIKLNGQGDWESLPMEAPLQGLPLVAAGGKLYRIGGLDARNKPGEDDDLHSVADFHVFDPATKKWHTLPSLPEPRSSHDAVAIGSKIYVIGGWTLNGEDDGKWLDTAWVFETSKSNARWEALPTPTFRRRALAAAEWQGKLVALGGMDDDAAVSERVDIFDPTTGEWQQLADFPGGEMAGFGMSAWSLDSGLYASGAEGVLHRLADNGKSWVEVSEMQVPRFFHRLLPADRDALYVVAGASFEHGHVGTIEKLEVKRVQ